MVGTYLTGVAILEELSMPFMPPVETNGVSSEQSSHQCGKRDCAGSKKKMGMFRQQRPGITGNVGFGNEILKTG